MKKIFTYIAAVLLLAANVPAAFAQYQVNGNASSTGSGCYQLTPNLGAQAGSVWNTNLISLTQPFDFTFNIFLGCDDAGADGICFGLQPLGTTIGSSGNGMGMGGVSPSLGVFIDTYQNSSPDNDPAYDHISLNSNGDVNHTTANNLVGPVQASASDPNIEDCAYHTFRVQWDPATQTYQVWIDGVLRLSYTGDIVTTIFGGNPNVYWGFTGATGGLTNEQSFCIVVAANFIAPPVCVGTATTFTDQTNSGSTITSWSWNFGDGTPVFTGSTPATYQNPTHTYTAAGTYNVLETVTNTSSGSSTISHTVTVVAAPSVTASGGVTLCTSQTVNLSGTVSGSSIITSTFTTDGSNSNIGIPDNGTTTGWTGTTGSYGTSNIPVTGLNPGFGITSVSLNITHTFDGDLTVYLFDPCGNSIQLINSNGGAGDNFTNTSFTPGATVGIGSSTAPFNGTFVPAGGTTAWNAFLSAAAGCGSANGTWSLHAGDHANIDVGTIVNWSISFSNPSSPSYSWAPTAGMTGATTLTPTVAPTATTTYTLTASNSMGCISTATTTVTINPAPVLSITNPPAACAPGSVDITAAAVTAGSTGGGTLGYYTDASGSTPLSSPNAITTSGTYYIQSSVGSCKDIKPVTVTISPAPVLNITSPAAICGPASVDLTLPAVTAGSTGGGTLSYYTDGSGTTALTSPNAVSTSGTYFIESTVGTCSDIEPVTVTINPGPALTITSPAAACAPGSVNITLPAVTAGSTGGGTLSYYTDASATTALTTPTAITSSGTYYIESTVGSCTDIEPVTVTISPAPVLAITSPAAVCGPASIDLTLPAVTAGSTGAGTFSYYTDASGTTTLLSPNAVTTSGTYYIQSTVGTCSDIKPVTVTINPTPSLTITSPAAVCGPASIDLTAAAVTAGSTGGGTLTYYTDGTLTTTLSTPNAVSTSGTYYIESTAGSCSDFEPVTVTINPTPVLAVSSPAAVCGPASIDLTAASVTAGSTGGGTLTYYTDAAATSPLASPNAVTTSGTYYIQSSNGACSDVAAVTVTINPTPVLTITSPAAICAPGSIDLTAAAVTAGSTGGGTLTYYTNSTLTTTLPSPNAVTTSGTYYIQSSLGACSDVEPVTVTINATPVLAITSPAAVCAPGSVNITAPTVTAGSTGSGTLSYWTNAAATSPLGSPNAITTSGTYYIESSNGSCSDIEAITVTVNAAPVADAGTAMTIGCAASTVVLNGSASSSGATYSYNWTTGGGHIVSGGSTTNPSIDQAGTYVLTVTNTSTGCSSTSSVAVSGSSGPIASFTANPATGTAPLVVNFSNTSSNAVSYSWTFEDIIGASTDVNPTYTYTHTGTYQVCLIAVNAACADTACSDVEVTKTYALELPNVFTPNGDGNNDIFRPIVAEGVTSFNAVIYDRWGLKLFEWNNAGSGWDGKAKNGSRSPDGTYYYIIKVAGTDAKEHELTGYISLLDGDK